MKIVFAISVSLVLALNCLGAERRGAAADKHAPTKDNPATNEHSAVEVKNKSSFTMDPSGRNPFWPIGFKPIAKASKTEHAGPEIQPSAFVVSSITLGQGERLAIING